MSTVPDGYYAVPDPAAPDQQMTYWRMHTGRCDMWPAKARYGPVLYRKDRPKDRDQQIAWMREFHGRRSLWFDQVLAEITRDPAAAAARFAEFTTRCLVCGRTLTDAKSKLLGAGPDCRTRFDDGAFAEHVTPRIATAHAVHLSQTQHPNA